ncbi:MAG: ribose 5-phosphate isomerase B [Planctomycetota bacterium]|jgi:ribose 5-phosphate isomerase B
MRIAVGSDHAGFELKGKIISHLGGLGHEILDVGTESGEDTDYPIYAHRVGRKVADGSAERGVVVCGTGIGACMAVNKVGGIRGALVWNEENARLAGAHNNANVLCLGGRTMDHELALKMIDIWLETPFEGGRHERRIEQIEDLGAL